MCPEAPSLEEGEAWGSWAWSRARVLELYPNAQRLSQDRKKGI